MLFICFVLNHSWNPKMAEFPPSVAHSFRVSCGVSADTRSTQSSFSSSVPSFQSFLAPPPPWPPPFFSMRFPLSSNLHFAILSIALFVLLFSVHDFDLSSPRPLSCLLSQRHHHHHSGRDAFANSPPAVPSFPFILEAEARNDLSLSLRTSHSLAHLQIPPLLCFPSASSTSQSWPVTTTANDLSQSARLQPRTNYLSIPSFVSAVPLEPSSRPSLCHLPIFASCDVLPPHRRSFSSENRRRSSPSFSSVSHPSPCWPSPTLHCCSSSLPPVHLRLDPLAFPSSATPSSFTSRLGFSIAFLSPLSFFAPHFDRRGSLCISLLEKDKSEEKNSSASTPTRLYARRKQLKGAKRWNRRRPTKTRPSQINPKPVPWIPSIHNFANAPPEYLPAPSPEGETYLRREKISYLLYLLWYLPQQCRRGSSAFIPSPLPSSIPKPKPICYGYLDPSQIEERIKENREYQEHLSLQQEKEKQEIVEKLSTFLRHNDLSHTDEDTNSANTSEDEDPLSRYQISTPLSSSSSPLSCSPSPSDRKQWRVVNAAAAGISTEAAKEIQRLSHDHELLADLEDLGRFAQEQDDLALRLIHEHLVTAISPVSIPDYISEKRSFMSEEDQTFLQENANRQGQLPPSEAQTWPSRLPLSSSSHARIADRSQKAEGRESERSSPYIRPSYENRREDVRGEDDSHHEPEGRHVIREEKDEGEGETDKEKRSFQTHQGKDWENEDKKGGKESVDDEKERGEKKKKATVRLPLHLKRARERYESATYLVREVSRSPLTRYNRLLVAEAIDRWWRAWQLRRFAGLVKKKLKALKHLGRQFKAGGIPPETLLEDDAFERYHLLDDLPHTHFVSNYLRRHSYTFSPSPPSSLSTGHSGASSMVDPLKKIEEAEILRKKRRRFVKEKAYDELKQIGLLDSDGNLDVDQLRDLYGVQPNTYKCMEERKKEDERRRCLPHDRVSRQERQQQIKFRQAALGLTVSRREAKKSPYEREAIRWKEREEDENIGGKIARATAVFDALLREDFPEYKPIMDPYELETYLEAEYRVYTLKRELRKLYADWIKEGMPNEVKQPNKKDFLVYWMKLSKRQRKKLLYEEKEKAPKDASNAELMRRIKKRVLLHKIALHSQEDTPQGL